MRKNIVKAIGYVAIGCVSCIAALFGIIYMYFSSTFLPVYIGKTYVIGNRLIRYGLYGLLGIVMLLSGGLVKYGVNFLMNKVRKRRGRR